MSHVRKFGKGWVKVEQISLLGNISDLWDIQVFLVISIVGLMIGSDFQTVHRHEALSLFRNICMLSVKSSLEQRGMVFQ